MSSRSRNIVLLIGAARAAQHPVSSDSMHGTPEPHVQDPAARNDAAVYVRLVALPPSSTVDLANLVTPVTPDSSSTSYELTEITPVPEPTSSTSELTEITPVHTSSTSQTTFTSSSVSTDPTTESGSSAQPVLTSPSITTPASTGQHIRTHTSTDWVTVTLPTSSPEPVETVQHTGTITSIDWVTVTLPAFDPEPVETQTSRSKTVPITISPVTSSSSATRRLELPGGFLGGPPQPKIDRSGETQPRE